MARALVASLSGRICIAALIACFTAVAGGCQSDIVPVSGRVTLNGQPLAGADVTFQPLRTRDMPRPAGTGSVGRTDSQGRFSLRTVEPNRRGAVVGDHTVTISTSVGGPEATPAPGKPVPPMWRDGTRTFRVPRGGTSQANFDITVVDPPTKQKKRK